MGKVLGISILLCALIAGVAMYYLQVYHFYEEVTPTGTDDVQLTRIAEAAPEPILYQGFQAIDATSSPIRYRACFTTEISLTTLTETYRIYEDAEPLTAPGWFECFDAEAIGGALEDGSALAFLGQENIQYGIDRVVVVTEEGRGYAWQQINACGEVVFDGNRAPEGCPEPPQGY